MAGYGNDQGFRDYATAAGYVIPDGTTDPQIAAARQRGALVVDRFEPRFSGARTGGFQQERAWPRTGASTQWGEALPSDEVPVGIVNASYEAAWLELNDPGSLSPVVTPNSAVKREKVGPLEIEYAVGSSGSADDAAQMSTPVVTVINGMIWPFLTPVLPGVLVV